MDTDIRDPSIVGFCRRQKISRATFYNLKGIGKAPREYRIGTLIRISPEAEAEWVRERELEAARSQEAADAHEAA